MIAALLPVKEFHCSKRRLAGFLSLNERVELVRAMFEDVWAALREALGRRQGLDRLLVVSAEPYVIARCRKEEVDYLEEREARSHSDSVIQATRWARDRGITSLLSLPIDTPTITASEILALLELRRRFPVVIVPSADGSGTNALLRTPPEAIAPHFGPGSCRLHVDEAITKGLPHLVFRSPGLLSDLDTPEDLENFGSVKRSCRSWVVVRQLLDARRGVTAWS